MQIMLQSTRGRGLNNTVESKVVHEVNKPRTEKRRTGGVHGRIHLIDDGLNHARLTGRVGLREFARMRDAGDLLRYDR
eukprot:scaffold12465_cov119-Isochrysis_galbana.AAC.8